MLPDRLSEASFAAYPPRARALAVAQLALLQRLPLAFVPLLLRELIVYDWKFPAERADLDRQFRYLGGLAPETLRETLSAFERLKLTRDLEQTDWVDSPAAFSERLSAHLWATHQIDAFRAAAVEYVEKASASSPDPELPTHRLGIAVVGQGVDANKYRLFRKLERQGTRFTRVDRKGGVAAALDALAARAKAHPAPYGHWYIDGGAPLAAPAGVTQVSYAALSAPRAALQVRMQKSYSASVFDPEAFRSMLARIEPEEIGMDLKGDAVLGRYQLSLLTEGSGTQVFSTTFVQWAAREALRRAQPLTLLARFAPRQRDKQMNELLEERERPPELDPQGSLVDADMAAYYHWLNQRRLSGAAKSAFLAWFEDHEEAVVVAPSFDSGRRDDRPVELAELIRKIA
jgi:hypothetical protein